MSKKKAKDADVDEAPEPGDPLREARTALRQVTLVLLELRSREVRALGLDAEVQRLSSVGEAIIRDLGLLHLFSECPDGSNSRTALEERHGLVANLFVSAHTAMLELLIGIEELARAQISASSSIGAAKQTHDRFVNLLEKTAVAPNRAAALKPELQVTAVRIAAAALDEVDSDEAAMSWKDRYKDWFYNEATGDTMRRALADHLESVVRAELARGALTLGAAHRLKEMSSTIRIYGHRESLGRELEQLIENAPRAKS